jgi:hypothetical protein
MMVKERKFGENTEGPFDVRCLMYDVRNRPLCIFTKFSIKKLGSKFHLRAEFFYF